MDITLQMIVDYFADRVVCSHISEEKTHIEGLRAMTEGEPIEDHHLYLGSPSSFSKSGLAMDDFHESNDIMVVSAGRNWAAIKADDPLTLLNEVLLRFELFTKWERGLEQSLSAEDPLQALLDASESILIHPIRIADREGNLVAISKNFGVDDVDARWRNLITTKLIPVTIDSPVNSQRGLTSQIFNREPDCYEFSDGTRFIATGIIIEGESVGSIMVWEHTVPFTPATLELVSILQTYASLAVTTPHPVNSKMRPTSALLKDLLEGITLSSEQIETMEKLLPNRPYRLVRISKGVGTFDSLVRYRLANHAKNFDDALATVALDSTFILLSERLLDDVVNSLTRSIQSLYSIAISLPFSNLSHTNLAFRQTCMVAERRKSKSGIERAENFALDKLISNVADTCREFGIEHRGLHILHAYDARNKSELEDTLKAYLECSCNATRTAAKLFIHRNTLLNRLDKIVHLTGIDFDNYEERLHLGLSFATATQDEELLAGY